MPKKNPQEPRKGDQEKQENQVDDEQDDESAENGAVVVTNSSIESQVTLIGNFGPIIIVNGQASSMDYSKLAMAMFAQKANKESRGPLEAPKMVTTMPKGSELSGNIGGQSIKQVAIVPTKETGKNSLFRQYPKIATRTGSELFPVQSKSKYSIGEVRTSVDGPEEPSTGSIIDTTMSSAFGATVLKERVKGPIEEPDDYVYKVDSAIEEGGKVANGLKSTKVEPDLKANSLGSIPSQVSTTSLSSNDSNSSLDSSISLSSQSSLENATLSSGFTKQAKSTPGGTVHPIVPVQQSSENSASKNDNPGAALVKESMVVIKGGGPKAINQGMDLAKQASKDRPPFNVAFPPDTETKSGRQNRNG